MNCKHYLGGDISAFQTEFYEKTGAKYGLDRGVRREEALKHKTLKDFRDALLRKGVEMADVEEARAQLLAVAEEMDKQNQRLAQQQKEVNAQTKKNQDELINLRRIRDFLDNQAKLRIKVLQKLKIRALKRTRLRLTE